MTLLSDKLSLIGLLVILLEVALVVLVVSPEQARRARVAEQETATAVFGAPLAARARAFAARKFGETFVESGFLARVAPVLLMRAQYAHQIGKAYLRHVGIFSTTFVREPAGPPCDAIDLEELVLATARAEAALV